MKITSVIDKTRRKGYNRIMKLWIKLIKNEKILANIVAENDLPLTWDNYESMLTEACHKLDLSTPITLSMHFNSLVRFNITEYKARDFIEPIDFTKLTVENINED